MNLKTQGQSRRNVVKIICECPSMQHTEVTLLGALYMCKHRALTKAWSRHCAHGIHVSTEEEDEDLTLYYPNLWNIIAQVSEYGEGEREGGRIAQKTCKKKI
jgi:hypothetical protein